MKERPIIFSADSVQAILRGDKTQTRRLIRPQPKPEWSCRGQVIGNLDMRENGKWDFSDGHDAIWARCPFGQDGDRLWCRETWAPAHYSESVEYLEPSYFAWEEQCYGPLTADAPGLTLHYRADGEDKLPAEFTMRRGTEIPWRSPLFMPRWASRLTLEVVSVRAERLQDLTEEDAKAEGVPSIRDWMPSIGADQPIIGTRKTFGEYPYTTSFAVKWDELNDAKAPWSTNPWVWRIEFRRVEA